VELEVDGGIKAENARQVVQAGADVLVIGSAIFNRSRSVWENLNEIRVEIEQHSER
jgi:ribulose-phosphate 3-epimerase